MPGAVLSDLCPLFYSITILYEVYDYPHFIDEESEVLESSGSHSMWEDLFSHS